MQPRRFLKNALRVLATDEVSSGDDVKVDFDSADALAMTMDEARDAYNSRWEFIMIFLTPGFNVLFFLLFAAGALTHAPIRDMFPAENGLSTNVVMTGTDAITAVTTMKFSNMDTQADLFHWLTDTLLPVVFVTTDYNGNNLTSPDDLRRIMNVHRIIGAVEFKTYAAPLRPCDTKGPLGQLYPHCHDFNNPVLDTTFYINSNSDAASAAAMINTKQATGTWLTPSTALLHINIATFDGEL
ncbi:hypothetical protein As57867_019482, partial [Aphanomyces stellatus]